MFLGSLAFCRFGTRRALSFGGFAMSLHDDYRVIRWKDWYKSKGLSKWAAARLRKAGKGPRIVQLTEHAIGVTVKDDREWTEARIRDGQ
jgi:hypothetical protein